MEKTHSFFYHVFIFILAQLAWLSLLSLWIYWYVSNYIIFKQVGNKLSPQILSGSNNVFALVGGLILLVMVSFGMSLIFLYLNRQLSLTRMYDNFIANVTHELKSPLSSIQLYLETLKTRSISPEKRQEFITLMLSDVDRLNNLINSILYLSGFEQKKTARKYPHHYHVYQAERIFLELLGETQRQFKIPNEALHIEGNSPCECVIDRNWMRIVFDNLFDNAVKYSSAPVQISVRLGCSKKHVFIEISDQGIGVNPKDQKKIFQKFQRLNTPQMPSVKGTGLGLFWVNKIIKYHGGKISVFSAGLNNGTTFRIELPLYKLSKKHYIKNLLKKSKMITESSDEQE